MKTASTGAFGKWLNSLSTVDHDFVTELDNGFLVRRIRYIRSDGFWAICEQQNGKGDLVVVRTNAPRPNPPLRGG